MRPPEFTGGNGHHGRVGDGGAGLASMRPPEFTGGNSNEDRVTSSAAPASMRPPEFTGGNPGNAQTLYLTTKDGASMRPPEFTGGNYHQTRPCPLHQQVLQ